MTPMPAFRQAIALHIRSVVAAAGLLLAAVVPAHAALTQSAPASHPGQFKRELDALTSRPNRLAGTANDAYAIEYVKQRLKAIGCQHVLELDMPLMHTHTSQCQLHVAGKTIRLYPLRSDITVPPVTPPAGWSGPLIYVGDGRIKNYGDRSPKGAIVVINDNCGTRWQTAFALGAKAVIFLGDPHHPAHTPKVAGVPADLIRLYADPSQLHGINLKKNHPHANVQCRMQWQRGLGHNIIVKIPGTDPKFAGRSVPEAVVLAAHVDTFGQVPDLTPGARGAANVAALLQAAAYFHKHPAKRDIILMFLDNQAQDNQGARWVYNALFMSPSTLKAQAQSHQQEQSSIRQMQSMLTTRGLLFDRSRDNASVLSGILRSDADDARENLRGQSQTARLKEADTKRSIRLLKKQLAKHKDKHQPDQSLQARLQKLQQTVKQEQATIAQISADGLHWDRLRRALHNGRFAAFVQQEQNEADGRFAHGPGKTWSKKKREIAERRARRIFAPLFAKLKATVLAEFKKRLVELATLRRIDRQRKAIHKALCIGKKPEWIALHVDYNFSGGTSTWGPVAGNYEDALFAGRPSATGDNPGYYDRVLAAFRKAAAKLHHGHGLDQHVLSDPSLGLTFAASPFATTGYVAGLYGIYNVSLMTGYDARPRDGQPSDTVANLNWRRLQAQANAGTRLVAAVANEQMLSLGRVFGRVAQSTWPSWSAGRASGSYAKLAVTGGLAENRPAPDAVMAVWRGSARGPGAWLTLQDAFAVPNYEPIRIKPTNVHGRFPLVAMRTDKNHEYFLALGALFNHQGQVSVITSQDTLNQQLTQAIQIDLIPAKGHLLVTPRTYATLPTLLKILQGTSNSPFPPKESLWGQLGPDTFFYVGDRVYAQRVKIFQPMGPAALDVTAPNAPLPSPSGRGMKLSRFITSPWLIPQTAHDLWQLDENRMSRLRAHGVTHVDLELLHSHAQRDRRQAQHAKSLAHKQADLEQAAMLSHRVHVPLQRSMNDLVHAIIFLLILAVPFAFSLERLLICATSVYGRIGGFALMFMITFILLYEMHPGFAIAATPIIIFLAFAILLLATLVIYVVIRKFRLELKAMQGMSASMHNLDVSHAGTLLAAMNMGMSTMRRRPTRTTLTCITVVILTFTILCFASFSQQLGVRSSYQGPTSATTPPGILLHHLDYGPLAPGFKAMLDSDAGKGGLVTEQWWLTRQTPSAPYYTIATPAGDAQQIQAFLGIDPATVKHWPALAAAIGASSPKKAQAALSANGVFLPAIYQQILNLKLGQHIRVNGVDATFAGTIAGSRLERLNQIDDQSILPADFISTATIEQNIPPISEQPTATDLLLAQTASQSFVRFSSDQVAICSASLVHRLGGKPYSLTIYPGPHLDLVSRAKQLAQTVVMPVWVAGPSGVQKMTLTELTNLSGAVALVVPVILGGLIIFGTLLGSISDRENEIYTFSALGLSPGHIGVLFFAEAAVYAVVGGMGGQLLAQIVALLANHLAHAGLIQPTSINYSSTNSLFAMGIVMATVMISAIYPAYRASKSANPGLTRTWKMPKPKGDVLQLVFPFTVSAYDITGVVSFLAEHFRQHNDAGLGNFAASDVQVRRDEQGRLQFASDVALAPFDLGVTQHITLTATPSQVPGVDEVAVYAQRLGGARNDWQRALKVFMRDLRRQFLLWRTLSNDVIEKYRLQTLEGLGEQTTDEQSADAAADPRDGESVSWPQ